MAVDPAEDAIELMEGVTSLPRENVIAWLKANSNETDRAINAWMDGGMVAMPPKVSWDEADFHSDRNAERQQSQGPPNFTVDPPDTFMPNVFSAPSRPPSRVSNREGTLAATQQYQETEEEQYNRAINLSMTDSQSLPGQETGVMDPSGRSFGPAQQKYYDNDNWSMTIPGSHAREIILPPDSVDRKRRPGTPAFFKPSPDTYRLSALVKILHEIPIAREALLNTKIKLLDYGRGTEWWDGTPVSVLRVVNVDEGHQNTYAQDIIYETQRLMAFLDRTERAYGSTEVLSKLQGTDESPNDRVQQFFKDWQRITVDLAPEEPLVKIFQSTGIKRAPTGEESSPGEKFHCLSVVLDQHLTNEGMSLYDALDDVMWNDNDTSGSEVFLGEIGEVVTFDIYNQNSGEDGLGIEIPAVWYPDRYLESSIQQAKTIRDQKEAVFAKLRDLDETEQRLLKVRRAPNMKMDSSSLLTMAAAYFEQKALYRNAAEHDESMDDSVGVELSVSKPDDMLEELKAVTARVTEKLKTFEELRESARQQIKEISRAYTRPTNDPERSPTHKYTLRGVATTAQTLYVLEKTVPEAEDDILSSDAKDWQWWKLEFVSSDHKPVTTTRVSEGDVLKAAQMESRSVLVVYASESAMSYEESGLPSQLANFVRADNLNFDRELEEAVQNAHASPSKRKAISVDSDDLITEHPRSPPHFNRDHLADGSLDPNPPGYDSSPPSPTRMPQYRPLRPRPKGSSDDNIPISLMGGGTTMDPNYMVLDQDDMGGQGQEMQERGGSDSLLQNRSATKDSYHPGDYVPEIDMEDEEDTEIQGDTSRYFGDAQGRGNREDTY